MTGRQSVVILLVASMAGCLHYRREFSYHSETITVSNGSYDEANLVEIRQFAMVEGSAGEWLGSWLMKRSADEKSRALRVRVHQGKGSWSEHWIDQDDVKDYPKHDAVGAAAFSVNRPAGSLSFTGVFDNQSGNGEVRFSPSKAFGKEATARLSATLTDDETIEAFWADLSMEFISAVHAARPEFKFDDVMRLRRANVPAEYVSEFANAQYDVDATQLIQLRNSGVTADYAKEMKQAGYAFSSDELIRARNSGISAAYAREWKENRFELPLNEMIRVRNTGMPVSYATSFKEAGYAFDLTEITRLRNSGVPEQYAMELKAAGYDLSADELIKLRNSGVPTTYVTRLQQAGYSFSIDDIIRLRNSGVSDEYAAAIVVEGRRNLDAKEIIDLRNRGVNAETIRKLRS